MQSNELLSSFELFEKDLVRLELPEQP